MKLIILFLLLLGCETTKPKLNPAASADFFNKCLESCHGSIEEFKCDYWGVECHCKMRYDK